MGNRAGALLLPTFDELRQYVHGVLCQRADLDLGTPMVDGDIRRGGAPCGVEYLLLGPRSVRLSAIWDAPGGRLLFYDQGLVRFQVSPVQGPDPAEIPRRPRVAVRTQSLWRGK